MTADEALEQLVETIQQTVEEAENELMEVKMIRANDPTEFPYLQHQLNELKTEVEQQLTKATPTQRERLVHAQQTIERTQMKMIHGY